MGTTTAVIREERKRAGRRRGAGSADPGLSDTSAAGKLSGRQDAAIWKLAQERFRPTGIVDGEQAHWLPARVLGAMKDTRRDVRRVASTHVSDHRTTRVVLHHLLAFA